MRPGVWRRQNVRKMNLLCAKKPCTNIAPDSLVSFYRFPARIYFSTQWHERPPGGKCTRRKVPEETEENKTATRGIVRHPWNILNISGIVGWDAAQQRIRATSAKPISFVSEVRVIIRTDGGKAVGSHDSLVFSTPKVPKDHQPRPGR